MSILDEEKDFDQRQSMVDAIKAVQEFMRDTLEVLNGLKLEYKTAKNEYDTLLANASLSKRKDELYGEMLGLQKAINRLQHIVNKLPNPPQRKNI